MDERKWRRMDGEFMDLVYRLGLDAYAHETSIGQDYIRLTLWDYSWDGLGEPPTELPPIYAQVVVSAADDTALKVEAAADPRAEGMLLAHMLWVACEFGQAEGFPHPDWEQEKRDLGNQG